MFSDVGRPHELSSPQSGCFTLIVCPKPNYFPAWSKVCFAPWPVGCCKCLSHIHSGQHDLNQIGKTTVQNSLRFNKKANMLFDMLNLRFPRWTLLLSNYLPIKILLNCQILGDFPNPMEIFGFFWCFSSWMTWMTHLSPQKSIGRRSTEELQSLRKELQSPLQEARRNKFLRCFRKKPPGRSVEQNDL